MTKIVKIEKVSEERINNYLGIMQKDLQATIISLQCYGVDYDSYMIVYQCETEITLKKVLERISVPLD